MQQNYRQTSVTSNEDVVVVVVVVIVVVVGAAAARRTMGQNSQESGCMYMATRSSVCSFARTAHSACFPLLALLALIPLLARSVTHSRALGESD